jgi:hypothetical protein
VAGAKLSRRLHRREAPITRKGLIEMLDKSFEEEKAPRVDERLARVVRIIVEQYDGDVKAFVESNRYKIEKPRKNQLYETDASLIHNDRCDSVVSADGWLRYHLTDGYTGQKEHAHSRGL